MRAVLYSPLSGRRWFPPMLTAVGVVILISYLAGGALDVGLDDRVAAYSPHDADWTQIAASALDTPFAVPWLPSSVLGRASIAIALNRRSAVRDFAAAATAIACVMLGAWLYLRSVPIFPVLLATLGLGFGATFWGRGVAWSIDALAPVMAAAGVMLGQRWHDGDRRFAIGAASVFALAAALLEDPTWFGVLPAAAWLMTRSAQPQTPVVRVGAVILLAGCAIAGVFLRLEAARNGPWTAMFDVPTPTLPSMWAMRIREGAISPIAMLTTEFTSLGSLLALIALAVAWQTVQRRVVLALLIFGLVAARYLVPQMDVARAGAPIAVSGWAAIASALAWLASRGEIVYGWRSAPLVGAIAALFVAQPTLTRARVSGQHEGDPAHVEAHAMTRLRWEDFPSDAAVVSTNRFINASLEIAAGIGNARAVILPQTVPHVESAARRQRPTLLSFPTAERNLALLGFVFERAFVSNTRFGVVVGRQPCTVLTPNQWVDVTLQLDGRAFSLRSDRRPLHPGSVTLYIAASGSVAFAEREAPSLPFQTSPVPPETESEARARFETTTGRSSAGRGPITRWTIGPATDVIHTAVALSESPYAAIARSDISAPVSVCSAAPRTEFVVSASSTTPVSAPMMSASVFGIGWHTPEGDRAPFRWTAEADASIRVHVARPQALRVTIAAAPAAPASAQARAGLQVNRCQLADHPMPQGSSDFIWNVPGECWTVGSNQLWLRTGPLISPASLGAGPDTRILGARVTAVRVDRLEPR